MDDMTSSKEEATRGGRLRMKNAIGLPWALGHIARHLGETRKTADIFCPLAGDDPFLRLAWSEGHSVTAIGLVPRAVAAMREQFPGSWSAGEERGDRTVRTHESGRATLYQGDALARMSELVGKFDVIYDKDSFGGLDKSLRADFCERVAEYARPGAALYVEVKRKSDDRPQRDTGPPFSVTKEDLMEEGNFGGSFEYVEDLGDVYKVATPNMAQTGHVLRRRYM